MKTYAMQPKEPVGIMTTNLMKIYPDPSSDAGVIALRGVQLHIDPGAFVSVIGPSGAGKSTLLQMLGGFSPPSAGEIYIGDIPVHSLRNRDLDTYRKLTVGFLWQLPERNLLPSLSVEQNIDFVHNTANYPKEKRKTRAKELITAVGLSERKQHKLGQLSGGEAQRASLAVALANEPKVLFCDEPTGELDSETTLSIIHYLQDINQEHGITMVVVTHDNRFERMTTHSYRILDGQISGIRRAVSGQVSRDWKSALREELAFVDQYGNVRIPADLREKAKIGNYVKFHWEDGRLYIIPDFGGQ